MLKDTLYIAEVKDNDDNNNNFSSGKECRVKIYIQAIMEDYNDDDLPWARPFFGDGNKEGGIINIPNKGDKIWVFCEDNVLKRNWFYLTGISLKKFNALEKLKDIEENLKKENKDGGVKLETEYPKLALLYQKNGIVIGISKDDDKPEIFIYQKEKVFISINKDGDIVTSGKWKHYGEFTATKEITAMAEEDSQKVTLSQHVHTSAAPGAPTTNATPGK